MTWQKTLRRGGALLAGIGALTLLPLAGCGGGGTGNPPLNTNTTPTDATRARVQDYHAQSFRSLTQAGASNVRFASLASAGVAEMDASAPTGANGTGFITGAPLIGAFLRNIAAVPPRTRVTRMKRITRQMDDAGTSTTIAPTEPFPGDGEYVPPPTFYFDEYLGLWTQTEDSDGKSVYRLYQDEAKTQPAGEIETTWPTDFETFPQVYRSSYRFTAGLLKGSYGTSENTTNADYSGSSKYENVYADGWTDKGSSTWTARGDSTWTSRTEGPNGYFNTSSGTFRADGSGGVRTEDSTGYASNYTFNADGSGRGTISGPDPGLPVTITWDAFGNTTIRYADGTVETIPGWGGSGGGGNVGVGGGSVEPLPAETPAGEPSKAEPATAVATPAVK